MNNSTPDLARLVQEAVAQGETAVLTIASASMTPLLPVGAHVQVKAILPEQLKAGDIITLTTRRELWTHRFWGWQDGQLQTRGDRQLKFDPLWQPNQLVGKLYLSPAQEKLSRQIFGWLQWEVENRVRFPYLVRLVSKSAVNGLTAVHQFKGASKS